MSRINTPTNQKLLTNVAVVRMKKCGKRFELACYKNKVVSWREGIEKDLDEVLQSHTVFTNVSKGEVAKKADLVKCFDEVKGDQAEVIKLILAKGDLQVSDKERQAQQEALFKDVATLVSEMCVNPESKRPYPVSMIEKAMKEAHIGVKVGKGSKQQALDTVGKLKDTLTIERAQMRLKIVTPVRVGNSVRKGLGKLGTGVTIEEEQNGEAEATFLLLSDPGQFRNIDDLVKSSSQGAGTLELLSLKEIKEDEEKL